MGARYTAVVLDEDDRQNLIKRFIHLIPKGWDIIAHHMTINMGDAQAGGLIDEQQLGEDAFLTINSVAGNDKVLAVGVETDVPSKNDKKHITLAVNKEEGGKPVMSNHLEDWEPLPDQFEVSGTIQEVK